MRQTFDGSIQRRKTNMCVLQYAPNTASNGRTEPQAPQNISPPQTQIDQTLQLFQRATKRCVMENTLRDNC